MASCRCCSRWPPGWFTRRCGRPEPVAGAGHALVPRPDRATCERLIARAGWGFRGLTCRVGVLLSGASIDGSLWYGDLPAPDAVEISDIAAALSLSRIGALSTLEEPGLPVGVGRADEAAEAEVDGSFEPASALLTTGSAYLHAATDWLGRSLVSSLFSTATEPLVRHVALVNVPFPEEVRAGP